jgi:hypothetical protein
MEESGSEIRGTAGRRSKVLLASLISLVLGLVAYVTGFLIYSYGWNRAYIVHYNPFATNPYKYMEWGQWAEGAGIILVILGLVFYVAWKRKGV